MPKRSNRTYTETFKKSAIQLALRSATIQIAAAELGIPKATLATWVSQFKDGVFTVEDEREEAQGHEEVQHLKDNLARLLEDNRALNKKIALLEEERQILKKAAACVP